MDIEKLIRRLRNDADAYRNGETLGRAFADQEDVLDNAATALSTLQAENEKLRVEAEGMRSNWYKSVEEIKKLRAELEQVKAGTGCGGELGAKVHRKHRQAVCRMQAQYRGLCLYGNMRKLRADGNRKLQMGV